MLHTYIQPQHPLASASQQKGPFFRQMSFYRVLCFFTTDYASRPGPNPAKGAQHLQEGSSQPDDNIDTTKVRTHTNM